MCIMTSEACTGGLMLDTSLDRRWSAGDHILKWHGALTANILQVGTVYSVHGPVSVYDREWG